MGLVVSCGNLGGELLSDAIRAGDIDLVKKLIEKDPGLLNKPLNAYQRLSSLHIAALYGRAHVMEVLLEAGAEPNVCGTKARTPLMVACKRGKAACVDLLVRSGANVLAFEASNGRTCLHYAARGGHYECVERIIDATRTGPVAESWGFIRFVNVRDAIGTTPLHMAARAGKASICRLLLDNGAFVSATTSTFGFGPKHGSTTLHSAAKGGSVEVIHELLAWGADRTQKDLMGRTPYEVAVKYNNMVCAAILNPNVAEPMVWPSPWKFISNLEPQTKSILQAALVEANRKREKGFPVVTNQKEDVECNSQSVSGRFKNEHQEEPIETGGIGVMEICCICFEKFCTIEVKDCGHQMCASCTLELCCHNKPNPLMPYSHPPACPFCRGTIGQLVLAEPKHMETKDKDMMELAKSRSKRFKKQSWGSISKCSTGSGGGSRGSFRILGKGSGRIVDAEWMTHL